MAAWVGLPTWFQRAVIKVFGAVGQYNLVKPVIPDGGAALLQLDVNGSLLVVPGGGAVWVVGGPGLQDDAINNAVWRPVEISYESEDIDGAAFNTNVPVSQDGDVVRPKASRHGVQYVDLVLPDGSRSAILQEDTAGANGDAGVFVLARRNDNWAVAVTSDNGDYSQISVDDRGRVGVWDSAPQLAKANYSTWDGDGSVVWASNTTLTFTGPALVSGQLRRVIVVVSAAAKVLVWEQGRNADLTISGATVTVWPYDGTAIPVPAGALGYGLDWSAQDKAYDPPTNSIRTMPVWSPVNQRTPGDAPITLASAQALSSTTWAAGVGDVGPELDLRGMTFLAVWINVTINNSQNVRIRALAKHTSAGADEFTFPLKAMDTSATPWNVKIQGDFAELDVDADQKLILFYPLYNSVPFVQMQAMVEVPGASPATITAYATFGFGGAS